MLITGGKANGHLLGSAGKSSILSTGKFSAAGNMQEARSSHTAALLPDGRVLICGGTEKSRRSEIYDPRVKTFVPAGEMTALRSHFIAVTLKDGRVLLAGGAGASAEVFIPESGAFSAIGSMTTTRYGFSATLLNSGQVLIAGGTSSPKEGEPWLPRRFSIRRQTPSARRVPWHGRGTEAWPYFLNSGKVLITGGSPQNRNLRSGRRNIQPWSAVNGISRGRHGDAVGKWERAPGRMARFGNS